MKSLFKYFYFNKKERLALFVFCILLVSINTIYFSFEPMDTPVCFEFDSLAFNGADSVRTSQKSNFVSPKYSNSKVKPIAIKVKPKSFLRININQADSLAFSTLNGIGPIFSSRIVRYRNWLGGFHSKEQLLDVYGIDSMLFNHILPHLMVSSSDVKKMNINTTNFSSLASHPYITKSIANSIIKYRNHHGNFTSLAQLKLIPLIDEDLFRKIAFYLTIE